MINGVFKSTRTEWPRHVARMGKKINTYTILVGKNEGKKPLGKPGRRWEDNNKGNVKEIG
jgi:hypothetical protein